MAEDDLINTANLTPKVEQPFNVSYYHTTYGRPRFLGIPRDDQLNEQSSMEGILHGRKISEVYEQDTLELEKAGISWDRAVHVLKCLSVASAYQDEQLEAAHSSIRAQILQGKKLYSVDEHVKQSFEAAIKDARDKLSGLAGFGSIKSYRTG